MRKNTTMFDTLRINRDEEKMDSGCGTGFKGNE